MDEPTEVKCKGCHTNSPTTDIESIKTTRKGESTAPYCPSCASTKIKKCKNCDGLYPKTHMETDGKTRVCNDCFKDDYFRCPCCSMIRPDTDARKKDNGEQSCTTCEAPMHELKSPLILEKNEPIPPKFHGDKDGRYLGVELETLVGSKSPRWVHDVAKETLDSLNGPVAGGRPRSKYDTPFAYLKKDASLDASVERGEGKGNFEIISHPATLDYHKKQWEKFLSKPPKGLLKGGKGSDGWGFHVHVDRSQLSEDQIGKMLLFINSSTNAPFIEHMAGRDPGEWGKLDPNKTVADAKKKNKDRFEALNLQGKHTVEFRIFKGTLDKKTFFSRLEFCDALTEFCKDAEKVPLHNLHGVETFHTFVKENQHVFPHLAESMNTFTTAKPKSKK